MKHRLILACAALLALCPAARADKFYFTTAEEDAKAAEGSVPSFVEGVLLREEGGFYVVRVEGGEIQLAKDSVKRIEKTDLTVAQLEEREKSAAEKLVTLGESKRNESLDIAELAAYTMTCNLILNLDEVVTKE